MAGYLQENQSAGRSQSITVLSLMGLRSKHEKITMLTCYDASFAALMDRCGVEKSIPSAVLELLPPTSVGLFISDRSSVRMNYLCYLRLGEMDLL